MLRVVLERPGLTQSEIARATGFSKSRVSEVLLDLEREGLIRRARRGNVVLVFPSTPVPRGEERRLRLGVIKACEYVFIAPFRKALKEKGYSLEVSVYSDGLAALWSLVTGEVDLALAPIASELLFYALTGRLRILGGGAGGGAWVLENPRAACDACSSTLASSMEVLVKEVIGRGASIIYERSGERIVFDLEAGRARYAALWEPYASMCILKGYRVVQEPSTDLLPLCCCLAASTTLSDETREVVVKAYAEAVEEACRSPERWIEAYSAMVGVDSSYVRRAIGSYTFTSKVPMNEVERMLRRSGLELPSPSIIREAVEKEAAI